MTFIWLSFKLLLSVYHLKAMSFSIRDSGLPADLFTTNRAPDEGELAAARKLIRDLETWLHELTAEAGKLEAGVLYKEELITESLAALRNVVSPIRRVPMDIIRMVLLTCLDPGSHPFMEKKCVSCTLSHISSGIRGVALCTPELWTGIGVMVDEDPLESGLQRQKYWLEELIYRRSGNYPLHICFIDKSTGIHTDQGVQEGISQLSNLLLSCHFRWRKLTLSLPKKSCLMGLLLLFAPLTPRELPHLTEIDLGVSYSRGFYINDSLGYIPLLGCPGLTKVLNVTLECIYDHKSYLPLSNITDLACTSSIWRPSLFTDFSNILRSCVSLVSLTFYPIHGDMEWIEPAIDLPCLQHLKVRNLGNATLSILRAINAPRLLTLRLQVGTDDHEEWFTNYNVEFLQRSPNLRALYINGDLPADALHAILRSCPMLVTLKLSHNFAYYMRWDELLSSFVETGGAQAALLPNLQNLHLNFYNGLKVKNFNSLRTLVTRKLEPSQSLATWKELKIRFHYFRWDKEEVDDLLKLNDSPRIVLEGVSI